MKIQKNKHCIGISRMYCSTNNFLFLILIFWSLWHLQVILISVYPRPLFLSSKTILCSFSEPPRLFYKFFNTRHHHTILSILVDTISLLPQSSLDWQSSSRKPTFNHFYALLYSLFITQYYILTISKQDMITITITETKYSQHHQRFCFQPSSSFHLMILLPFKTSDQVFTISFILYSYAYFACKA